LGDLSPFTIVRFEIRSSPVKNGVPKICPFVGTDGQLSAYWKC
jgi:hypothetical protein